MTIYRVMEGQQRAVVSFDRSRLRTMWQAPSTHAPEQPSKVIGCRGAAACRGGDGLSPLRWTRWRKAQSIYRAQ